MAPQKHLFEIAGCAHLRAAFALVHLEGVRSMRSTIRGFLVARPFTAGIFAAFAIIVAGVSLVAARPLIQPFINGTVAYVATTSGPVVYGDNKGSGIGVEGVTDTTAPAGAIALQGFGTSTTNASVGVNGAVDAPGSTALIGNANAASGAPSVGLEGFAANGEGVFAESLSSSFPSLRSTDANAFFDVRLSDAPNGNGETATLSTASSGAALLGQDTASGSTLNNGVVGTTANGLFGVEGTATGNGVDGVRGEGLTDGQDGVVGVSVSGGGVGVEGFSTSNTGVLGSSQSGNGAFFTSTSSNAVIGMTQGTSQVGLWGQGQNFQSTFGVVGTGSAAGVATECAADGLGGTGTAMILGYDSTITLHYEVDCSGNVSTFLRTRHGMVAQAYAPRNASATVEDEGEAQLVNGSAAVRLDSAFADSISDRSTYLVFITPQGDSKGLYVTRKTLTGFEVHESMGGRSTLAFDYRIVAKPNGIDLAHMPLFASPNSIMRTHPAQSANVMLAIARARQGLSKSQVAKLGAHARTLRLTNIYEPRIGSNGKLQSVPIKYINIVTPH